MSFLKHQLLLPRIGNVSFEKRISKLPGILAYWKLDETTGTTITNYEGTAARDGAYEGSPSLATAAFPVGGNVVDIMVATQRVNLFTSALASALDLNDLWVLYWSKLHSSVNPKLTWRIQTDNASPAERIDYNSGRGASAHYIRQSSPFVDMAFNRQDHGEWFMTFAIYDSANGAKGYHQGVLTQEKAWSGGTLGTINFFKSGGDGFLGSLGHVAVGAGAYPTDDQINTIFEAVYPNNVEMFFCGDSKVTNNDYWVDRTIGNVVDASSIMHRERPYRIALSGKKVADLHTELDSSLASIVGNPQICIVNVGANDVVGPTSEASFKADMRGCLDALHTRWPAAKIYWENPYRADASYDTECDNIETWVIAVLAESAYSGFCFRGTNENSWFKAGIATYSSDNIHYNDAGHTEAASRWQTVLGF